MRGLDYKVVKRLYNQCDDKQKLAMMYEAMQYIMLVNMGTIEPTQPSMPDEEKVKDMVEKIRRRVTFKPIDKSTLKTEE